MGIYIGLNTCQFVCFPPSFTWQPAWKIIPLSARVIGLWVYWYISLLLVYWYIGLKTCQFVCFPLANTLENHPPDCKKSYCKGRYTGKDPSSSQCAKSADVGPNTRRDTLGVTGTQLKMHFCVRRRFSFTPFLLLILPAVFLFLSSGRADLNQLDQDEKEVELSM